MTLKKTTVKKKTKKHLKNLKIKKSRLKQQKRSNTKKIKNYYRNFKFDIKILSKSDMITSKDFKKYNVDNILTGHSIGSDRFKFYIPKKDNKDDIKNNNNIYLLKSVRENERENNYLLQSLNEVFASLIYNRIFKFYTPYISLVYVNKNEKYNDNNFLVSSKVENKIGGLYIKLKKNNKLEFINSFLVNCILANKDAYGSGNLYYVKKDIQNNFDKELRINYIDVGGSMIYKPKGKTKESFINNSNPTEHIDYIKFKPHLFNQVNKINMVSQSLYYLQKINSKINIENEINKIIIEINIYIEIFLKNFVINKKLSNIQKTKIIKDCKNMLETNKSHLIRRYKWYLENKNKVLKDIKKL
jgi:hypothetical protein